MNFIRLLKAVGIVLGFCLVSVTAVALFVVSKGLLAILLFIATLIYIVYEALE